MLQKIEGVSLPPNYGPVRAGDVRDSQSDTSLAVEYLKHSPQQWLRQMPRWSNSISKVGLPLLWISAKK